jgi:hypothetical protein
LDHGCKFVRNLKYQWCGNLCEYGGHCENDDED